jgi:hypothetical protein
MRWMVRISLGFLVLLYVAIAALSIVVAIILIQPLISNTHPPPLLVQLYQDQPVGAKSDGDANRTLTTLLQRRFPTGTSEGALKATLLDQGFNSCRPGHCLRYTWGRFPCGASLTVWWTVDHSAFHSAWL